MTLLRPTDTDLERLKSPLGELLSGKPKDTIPRLRLIIQKTNPPFITAVGDVVSNETVRTGIRVDLRIVDHRSMRRALGPSAFEAKTTYRTTNPAGVINMKSWNVIRRAMKKRDALIMVNGEEDLLALPCILESPEHALVLYGQPSEGMVVVTVSPRIKREVKAILERASREVSE